MCPDFLSRSKISKKCFLEVLKECLKRLKTGYKLPTPSQDETPKHSIWRNFENLVLRPHEAQKAGQSGILVFRSTLCGR